MHPWIKSALLPACSAYLINTPLQTLRRQARGAWPSRKSLANTSTSDLHHLLQRPRRRAQTDLVGRQQLHVAQRLPARQIDRAQSLLDQFSAGRPPLPCNRQSASEAGKTSNSQRPNLFLLFHHRRREHLLDLHQARGQPLLERILRRGLQHLAIGRDTVADERRRQRLARFGRD